MSSFFSDTLKADNPSFFLFFSLTLQHLTHPFPNSTQKKELAAAKDLPLNSINLW